VPSDSPQYDWRWPHRLAVLLVCATYPLIWVGGLVTSTKSGMAVPDWPSTFGYNLFLYPVSTWLFGPYDLFVEHGHRLLASLVGFMCIVLLGNGIWRRDRTLILLGSIALGLVLFQGVLGGLRVVADKTTIAQIHGCVGPLCFGYLVLVECLTARRWRQLTLGESPRGGTYLCWSVGLVAITLLQIAFGSILRHNPIGMDPATFRLAVIFHVVTALAVAVCACGLFLIAATDRQRCPFIWRLSSIAALLVLGQISLGIGSWIVRYGWPTFLPGQSWFPNLLIEWESLIQAFILTSHVAIGSLILGVAVTLSAYAWKRYPVSANVSATPQPTGQEVLT